MRGPLQLTFFIAILLTIPLHAQRVRAVGKGRPTPPPIQVTAEPASCAQTPPAPITCDDGGTAASSLSAAEVATIARAASDSINDAVTVAVVDRAGRPLAIFRRSGIPSTNDELAVGVARTAAF
ncbi:MAG TPA: heme-binding protein, partial [Thermoanaerobaculia bacterium]|nr:heme-binding protein [Thermoanaerobaculia bacterium]